MEHSPAPTHPLTHGTWNLTSWKPYIIRTRPTPLPAYQILLRTARTRIQRLHIKTMSTAPSTNPAPPDAKATVIDFAQTPCTNYAKPPHYALIIDNAFTREECADLIRTAESTPGASWAPALINSVGPDGTLVQQLRTGTRDSGRIMRDDTDLAEWMYQRVLPFLEDEIKVIEQGKGKWPALFYEPGTAASGAQWKMKRLNERLRFLRYEEAQYFKTHCKSCPEVVRDGA